MVPELGTVFAMLLILIVYLVCIVIILFRALKTESLTNFEVGNLPKSQKPQRRVKKLESEKVNIVSQEKPEPFSLEGWFKEIAESVREERARSVAVLPSASTPAVQETSPEAETRLAPEVEDYVSNRLLTSTTRPTREQLETLKQKLGVQRGSLQFKDGSVYHVEAEGKKRVWKRLGRWSELATQFFSNATAS